MQQVPSPSYARCGKTVVKLYARVFAERLTHVSAEAIMQISVHPRDGVYIYRPPAIENARSMLRVYCRHYESDRGGHHPKVSKFLLTEKKK